MTSNETRVSFVGAGQMGGPMVQRLLDAGVPTTVYARRAEVRERFAARRRAGRRHAPRRGVATPTW